MFCCVRKSYAHLYHFVFGIIVHDEIASLSIESSQ